jgi:hypothetical protein
MGCQLIGRWRIVAADLWEGGYLDLCGPAMLDIRADGHGEIAFGALQASLDLAYGHVDVSFDWEGDDDMHEVRGSGSAELLDDGSLEIEFEYHRGDDAILKASATLLQQPAGAGWGSVESIWDSRFRLDLIHVWMPPMARAFVFCADRLC